MIVRGYRDNVLTDIVDIDECTYSGKDMGERVVTATLKYPYAVDFQIGDYMEIQMATLSVSPDVRPQGGVGTEKFYLYSVPSVKKIASAMSAGDAFEHTLKFYPRQKELGHIVMRDLVQENSANGMVYTGFGDFTFYGGAKTMAQRIQLVLDSYCDRENIQTDRWNVYVSDTVNEIENGALEKYQYTMSNTTVMDALIMLTNEDNVHTSFYVTGRNIYIGYTKPTVCALDKNSQMTRTPYVFHYGKTSHMGVDYGKGGIFDVTKVIRDEMPVTRLYVYGGNQNLNRFYCADRLKAGRYVDRLMLPSFSEDGKTDYIDSPSGIAKFGIHEGVKTFDDIYPSIRNITYGDLRKIRYVIKLMTNGLVNENEDENENYTNAEYMPVARIQCYKVVKAGPVNKLVESWPDQPLAVFIHALSNSSKRIQTVLWPSQAQQSAQDAMLPKRNDTVIPGSCFAIHKGRIFDGNGNETEPGYDCLNARVYTSGRDEWFANINGIANSDIKREVSLQQVNYDDTARITDVFVFESYTQTKFSRDGYSPYCWPRVNEEYPASYSDYVRVDELVRSTPVKELDTYQTVQAKNEQSEFQIYLRDVGFKINEQTPFGDLAHLINGTFTINFRDGMLGGLDFEVKASNGSEKDENVVPAYKSDGTKNDAFVDEAMDPETAAEALACGAFWRITCKRNDSQYDSRGEILPNAYINANEGDHLIFTNIYMPNVYITAAENRMLREAQKYLNDNDNHGVDYSVSMDKIRMQQVPALALQLREGVTMRVEDEDLQIATDNEEKVLYDGAGVGAYRQTMYKASTREWTIPTGAYKNDGKAVSKFNQACSEATIYIPHTNYTVTNVRLYFEYYYYYEGRYNNTARYSKTYAGYVDLSVETQEDAADSNKLFSQNATDTITKLTARMDRANTAHVTKKNGVSVSMDVEFVDRGTGYDYYENPFGFMNTHTTDVEMYCAITHSVTETAGVNSEIYDRNMLLYFQAGKYYTVVVDLPNSDVDGIILDTNNRYVLYLYNGSGSGASKYKPVLTKNVLKTSGSDTPSGYVRREMQFYLEDSFDDSVNHYVGFDVMGDGETEFASFRIVSVTESNTDANGNTLPYVDLVLDQITVKLTNSSKTGWVDTNTKQEVFREIQATVKEQQKASAWGSLMQTIDSTQLLGEHNEQTLETLATTARRRFNSLKDLRESIFDPDGTCNDTFIQTMMLQVGADSMCYSLDNTKVFNGTMRNMLYEEDSDEYAWNLKIGSDTLRHYVYTDGAQAGTWTVEAMQSAVQLENAKRYFVAVKASKTTSEASWIVTEEPKSADAYTGYWVFNYGIVMSYKNGNKQIVETRGNAYMYGDNVVCGRITTMDGGSYFDLTGNEMKMGNRFHYKNGKLEIGGANGGTGEYDPGMVLTNVLELKDAEGDVQAGMSGLKDDGVTLWGGGTYEKAKNQAQGLLTQLNGLLPVLLTKTGVNSRIGCLHVDSATKVSVFGANDNDKIVIETGADPYIAMYNDGNEVIRLTTGEINFSDNSFTKYLESFDFKKSDNTYPHVSSMLQNETICTFTTPSGSDCRLTYLADFLRIEMTCIASNTIRGTIELGIEPVIAEVGNTDSINVSRRIIIAQETGTWPSQSSGVINKILPVLELKKINGILTKNTQYRLYYRFKGLSVTNTSEPISLRNMSFVYYTNRSWNDELDTYVYDHTSQQEGSILIKDATGYDRTIICSNGILFSNARGGMFKIEGSTNGLDVVMQGLPPYKNYESSDSGTVTKDANNFIRVSK